MAEKTLLVIDDEADFVHTTLERLAFEGYVVHGAQSAAEAIAIIKKVRPDLILLDIMMPDMDGIQLFQILRARPDTAAIPIVFVSVRNDILDHAVVYNDRHSRILHKPFEMEELLSVVRECLAET